MPFTILEMVILHQIPLSPKSVRINNKASGIRSAVKTMLFTEGVSVFPYPEKAPAVVILSLIHI